MSKTNITFLGIAVLIIIAVIGSQNSTLFKKPKALEESEFSKQANLTGFKFKGQLVSIEGNEVKIKGFFTSSSTPYNLKGEATLSFKVNSSTSYRKLQIHMPSYESLRDSNGNLKGPYNIQDLPREEVVGSLSDLKDSVSKGILLVEGVFTNSTFDMKDLTAVEVFYQLLLSPPDEKI